MFAKSVQLFASLMVKQDPHGSSKFKEQYVDSAEGTFLYCEK